MARDIEKLLRDAAGTPTGRPHFEAIAARGRRRLWLGRAVVGAFCFVGLAAAATVASELRDALQVRKTPLGGVPQREEAWGIVFAGKEARGPDAAIYVASSDGTERRQIFDGPVGGEMEPAWSPDGTRVAFSMNAAPGDDLHTVDTNMEIFAVNADGGSLQRLTHNAGLDTNPAWSPDGTHIAFTRFEDGPIKESGNNAAIMLMDAHGKDLHELTDEPGLVDQPSWSPDGNWIVFTRYVAAADKYEIFTLHVRSGAVSRLTRTPHTSNTNPSWSPDGELIAFVADMHQNRLEGSDLYLIRANGRGVRRITYDAGAMWDPAWSPDGGFLALIQSRPRSGIAQPKEQVAIVDIEGEGVRLIGQQYERINGIDWR